MSRTWVLTADWLASELSKGFETWYVPPGVEQGKLRGGLRATERPSPRAPRAVRAGTRQRPPDRASGLDHRGSPPLLLLGSSGERHAVRRVRRGRAGRGPLGARDARALRCPHAPRIGRLARRPGRRPPAGTGTLLRGRGVRSRRTPRARVDRVRTGALGGAANRGLRDGRRALRSCV